MASELRRAVRNGCVDSVPLLISFIPIAASFGMLGIQNGLSATICILMSVLVFAGASQFMTIGLIASGAGGVQILLAVFLLNFRHFIMGISMRKKYETVPSWLLCAGFFGLTDESFALCSRQDERTNHIAYFITIAFLTHWSWVLGTVLGVFFSRYIPADISAGFPIILYALFISLLVTHLKRTRLAIVVCGASILLSCLTRSYLGAGWSVITAIIGATVLGGYLEGRRNV